METTDTAKWYKRTALFRLADMYREGFGHSRTARTLLVIVLIKVAILLLVFKLWLMPNRLNQQYDTDAEKAQGVREELLRR